MMILGTTRPFFDPRSFIRASSGNLTIVVSLGTVAVVLALGAAIDFARVLNTHTALIGAVDAAVLQAGASNLSDEDELQELAQKSLAQNYDETRYGVDREQLSFHA